MQQSYGKVLQLVLLSLCRIQNSNAKTRPEIQVLGTVDMLLVETTPVVVQGRLYRYG